MSEIKYKRILLKLSGEALSGAKGHGLDYSVMRTICKSIRDAVNLGVEIGIVVGGGNFWRGRSSGSMNRTRADHIGMLATTMNALAVADVLEELGVDVRVQTAIAMQQFAEPYIRNRAVRHLEKGRVVIFGCGTGNPLFSTDTAAALRAAEIKADAILMAKNIDGVYSADPKKDKNAIRYEEITYAEVIAKELKALDLTAAAFCLDNGITAYAFELKDPMNIYRVVMGEKIGTELHR